MLEKVNLSQKIEKEDYISTISGLETHLGRLQRQVRELGVPVIIVFEGWDASGKGTQINKLMLAMDARGFNVHPTKPPNEEETLRPFLWRFWIKTPENGRIGIFDRSWYRRVLLERVEKLVKKQVWLRAYEETNSLERQLVNGGSVVIKFFLHITKKEQRKRFKKLQKNSSTAWRVTKEDWRQNKRYSDYLLATEEMLAKTDTDVAPWTIVEAQDRRFATVKIFRTVIDALEQGIREREEKASKPTSPNLHSKNLSSSILDKADLTLSLTRTEYEDALKASQDKVRDLEHRIYVERVPVVIVYEGWDASGKGGNIRRLVQAMDPRGYEVIPIGPPNDIEKSHPYLWRFWKRFPKAGHVGIFDRSWYGRVLVERVEGFASPDEWKRAYKEINEMEEQWANFGTAIVKFWTHISQDEQLRRFEERQRNPLKQWKITDEDWRNREKWDQYKAAVDEMLYRTSTPYAPWTIIEGNCKLYARIKALSTVEKAIEDRL